MSILETINGINSNPFILANITLDSGILNHKNRLNQLKVALETLDSISKTKNLILTRNHDYSFLLFEEEENLLTNYGFKSLSKDSSLDAISIKTGGNWTFEDLAGFGTCTSPTTWRNDTGRQAIAPSII
jgi:hypothetical protein